MSNKGIGGHQSATSKTTSWITPPEIIQVLGPFDLDPCASTPQPWPCASQSYTEQDNGLALPWFGNVWMNPPYDRDEITNWLQRMSEYGKGIALVFARTDRVDYHDYIFPYAKALLFKQGRITFYTPAGTRARANGGAPNLFAAYNKQNAERLADSGIKGQLFYNAAPLIIVGVSPSWKTVVTMAMTQLEEADIEIIYEVVEKIAPDKCEANQHYRAKIRQQLQYHFTKIKRGYYGQVHKSNIQY